MQIKGFEQSKPFFFCALPKASGPQQFLTSASRHPVIPRCDRTLFGSSTNPIIKRAEQ